MPSVIPIDVSESVCESGAAAIRPAIEADLSTIVGTYTHHARTGTASLEIDAPDLAEMTRCFHTLQEAGMPYAVAGADGALFGYAYVGPHRARPAYRHTVEDSVCLDTAAQGRGARTLLLEALIRECQACDLKQMVAVVGDSRESPGSAKLHACCGFRGAGVLGAVGHKLGRWLDYLLMQRALRGSGTG